MGRSNDSFRDPAGLAREQRRRERSKRWEERSKRFWRSLLFTENGKPKSGFLIYTFCLSAVFIALHLLAFTYIVDWLAPLTESWPLVLGNLTSSLSVSAAVLLVGFVLHRLLKDKRLMLGTYLWLLLYTAAAIITMALVLQDAEAMKLFLRFALWFVLIPVGLGLALFYLLYRRDYRPETPAQTDEPAWKKNVRRS